MIKYVVQPNDTLEKIASKYGITVMDLRKVNSLAKSNPVYPGVILNVPLKRK